ncbi:MAG: DUF86 domain-containing protein [Anaerolineales bacterium]|nr:DUF86 domain-containing protein [Anaerolineales bacterium]
MANKYRLMAGYRNRLVHVYHEINGFELLEICKSDLQDFNEITYEIKNWLKLHPELLDETL